MATLKSVDSGPLKSGDSHKWEKNSYNKLALSWADPKNPEKDSTVSVIIGDAAAKPYPVPQAGIAVDKKKSGKLTNNTGKTINYTLS